MRRFLAPLVFLAFLGCGGGHTYDGVRYDTFEEAMASAARDDDILAGKIRKRNQPVAGPLIALLPSENFLYSLTSKQKYYVNCATFDLHCRPEFSPSEAKRKAIYLQQNHRSTIEAVRRSNLFSAVAIEVYEQAPDPLPTGYGFLIFCCEWTLYTPKSGPTGQPLPFDFDVEQRDQRMNQWIDALEEKLRHEEALRRMPHQRWLDSTGNGATPSNRFGAARGTSA
ncbi:MAG: hypothetical protein AB7S71_04710 [Dongiaceae bacterium]